MPALGLLVIILGIWVFINTINGNLVDVVEGKAQFNFQASSPSSSKSNQDGQIGNIVDSAGNLVK